jgi:hypothetical protein
MVHIFGNFWTNTMVISHNKCVFEIHDLQNLIFKYFNIKFCTVAIYIDRQENFQPPSVNALFSVGKQKFAFICAELCVA